MVVKHEHHRRLFKQFLEEYIEEVPRSSQEKEELIIRNNEKLYQPYKSSFLTSLYTAYRDVRVVKFL